MFLYLVQHAEAKREEEDPQRDLTESGLKDITKVADYVGKLNLKVSRVVHSGKTRAASTARVLAAALQPPGGVSPTAGLAPLDDPATWAGEISRLEEDLVLVGHLPHLDRLAALLVTGKPEPGIINFKMGGMVCLRKRETGQWAVAWMLTPEIILQ